MIMMMSRSPLSPVKTVSFTVTPVLRTCGRGVAGYRACGGAGASYCLAQQYFCDGRVNCAAKHGVLPPGEEYQGSTYSRIKK